jgi:hypothetical protein
MTDYLRAHRLAPVAGMATIIALVGWWWSGTTVPVPQIIGGLTSPVQLQLFVTVLMAPVTVWAFGEEVLHLEAASRRPLWLLDLAALVALLGPFCLAAVISVLADDSAHTAELVRNAALFVGLAFLARAVAGQGAALVVPIAYFLAVGTMGKQRGGSVHGWAFPADDANRDSVVAALVVLAVGVVYFAVRTRSRTR